MTISPARPDTPTAVAPVQSVWGQDGFGFDDLIDIVNPLQHLPVVGHVYRAVTGDEIGMVPRMVGGFLFGGPAGMAVATVNAGVEAGTGKDVGEQVMAALMGDGGVPEPATYATASAAYANPPTLLDGPAPTAIPGPSIELVGMSSADVQAAPVLGAASAADGAAVVDTAPAAWGAPRVHGSAERVVADIERRTGVIGKDVPAG